MTAREGAQETARKIALYHATLDAAGHDEATLAFCREWSMVQKMIYVGESDEQAMADVDEPLNYLARQSSKSFGGSAEGAGFKNSIVGVSAVDREGFLNKAMIVGGPETVAKSIAEYEAAGVDHLDPGLHLRPAQPGAGRRVAAPVHRLGDAEVLRPGRRRRGVAATHASATSHSHRPPFHERTFTHGNRTA